MCPYIAEICYQWFSTSEDFTIVSRGLQPSDEMRQRKGQEGGSGGVRWWYSSQKALFYTRGVPYRTDSQVCPFKWSPGSSAPIPIFSSTGALWMLWTCVFSLLFPPLSIHLSFLPLSHSFRALEPFCSFHKIWYSQNNVNEKWLVHNPARATLQSLDMKTNTLC